MSETPRTDKAALLIDCISEELIGAPDGDFVHVDFARTLERELSAANAKIAELERQVAETRNAALEEAAKVSETIATQSGGKPDKTAIYCAGAIRALKSQGEQAS